MKYVFNSLNSYGLDSLRVNISKKIKVFDVFLFVIVIDSDDEGEKLFIKIIFSEFFKDI